MDYLTPEQRRAHVLDVLWSSWEKLADIEAAQAEAATQSA